MTNTFVGKILLLADRSLNDETITTQEASIEKPSDEDENAKLRLQIAQNLRAKFEGDELSMLKSQIAQNLRERFASHDEDEHKEKKRDHEMKVGE